MNSTPTCLRALVIATVLVCATIAPAQDAPAAGSSAARELANANNPLADMTAFNIQNYRMSSLYDTDATANTTWLRFAKPIGRVLVRASLHLSTISIPGAGTTSGVGDFNIFGAYLLSDSDSPRQFGIGPLLAAPTASEDELGSDVWQAGAAAIYFNAESPVVQWGGLLTAQTKIGGDGPDTSQAVLQPFLFLQFGKGVYGGMAPLWFFDLESGHYNMPLGWRLGKVVKAGSTVFNMFLEPQFTMLHWGAGQPEFQVFAGLNMQFMQSWWIFDTLPWVGQEFDETRDLMGQNIWPYGVEANRKALASLFQYSYELGLASKRLTVEEVFHPSTLPFAEAD